jgi:hypothetical protein
MDADVRARRARLCDSDGAAQCAGYVPDGESDMSMAGMQSADQPDSMSRSELIG